MLRLLRIQLLGNRIPGQDEFNRVVPRARWRIIRLRALMVVEIGWSLWRHDHVVSQLRSGNAGRFALPTHDGSTRSEPPFQNFVPADKPAALLCKPSIHLLDEPT